MNVVFYNRKTDGTKTEIDTKDCKIKQSSNINNFTIIVHSDTFIDSNYCYIEKFHRYYNITNVSVFPNNMYQLQIETEKVRKRIKLDFENNFSKDGTNILVAIEYKQSTN